VYLANLKKGKNLIKIMVAAGIVFGASIMFLAYSKHLPIALVFMTLTGVGMMAQTSVINTYIQTHAVPAMRARAISYYVMAYQGMVPIGSLLAGLLAGAIGPRKTVFIEGAIGLIATVGYVVYRNKVNGKVFTIKSLVPVDKLRAYFRNAA
jgi:MFS family permease